MILAADGDNGEDYMADPPIDFYGMCICHSTPTLLTTHATGAKKSDTMDVQKRRERQRFVTSKSKTKPNVDHDNVLLYRTDQTLARCDQFCTITHYHGLH